jgi:hypothetical protein
LHELIKEGSNNGSKMAHCMSYLRKGQIMGVNGTLLELLIEGSYNEDNSATVCQIHKVRPDIIDDQFLSQPT